MNKKTGDNGENYGKEYLERHGFSILDTNFRCRYGEIDIIAKKMGTIHFIEVKTRKSLAYGWPCEAVTRKKLMHLIIAVKYYVATHKKENWNIQIDVIEILQKEGRLYINHIKDIILF